MEWGLCVWIPSLSGDTDTEVKEQMCKALPYRWCWYPPPPFHYLVHASSRWNQAPPSQCADTVVALEARQQQISAELV